MNLLILIVMDYFSMRFYRTYLKTSRNAPRIIQARYRLLFTLVCSLPKVNEWLTKSNRATLILGVSMVNVIRLRSGDNLKESRYFIRCFEKCTVLQLTYGVSHVYNLCVDEVKWVQKGYCLMFVCWRWITRICLFVWTAGCFCGVSNSDAQYV